MNRKGCGCDNGDDGWRVTVMETVDDEGKDNYEDGQEMIRRQ
jgi:hypothetical protein